MVDREGCHQELRDTCCVRPLVSYPPRSPLRRGFAVGCSISQNNQTKAVPRPTTIPRNTNVRAGAVSMFNIPDAMQAAYQPTQTDNGLDAINTGAAPFYPGHT
jgi:hypothetical protein